MGFVLCRRGYISLRIDRILQGLPRNVSTCCDWKGTAARIVIRIVCDVSVLFGANGGKVRIRRRGRNCHPSWVDRHLLALSARHILYGQYFEDTEDSGIAIGEVSGGYLLV